MKIAIFCDEYPSVKPYSGGIGTFTEIFSRALINNGHQVSVIGFGPEFTEQVRGFFRLVLLPESHFPKISWLLNRLKLWLYLRKEAIKKNIDIVEIPDWCGMLPFPTPFLPVVVRLHSGILHKNSLLRLLERRTLSVHKNWIAVSAWQGQDVQRKYKLRPKKMEVIYNPIEDLPIQTDVTLPGYPEKFVLYAGTVSERKGALITAQAARKFLSTDPELHLIYAGGIAVENGRPNDHRIRDIVGKALSSRVHFTGFVSRDIVLALMRKAQAFVFPSNSESFGLVVVEALSVGCPVVYSRCHAGPEVIEHGVTGLLADPYNPDDVAEKVLMLLSDQNTAKGMGLRAQQMVKTKFSVDACVEKSISFYKQLIAEQRKKT